MGRTQTFDTDAVVRAARSVFWEHGYEEASLPFLELATGLRRSSIYHAFGSKRGLFDAAVTSYLDEVIRPRLAPLLAADVAPTALVVYLTGLRAALADPETLPGRNGCLLVNAGTAPIGRDPAVASTIAGYREELRAAIAAGLDAAGRTDVHADTVAGLVVAALALVRVDPGSAGLTLDAALDLIR